MKYKSIEIMEEYMGYLPTRIKITMEDGTTKEVVASEKNHDNIFENECFKELEKFSNQEESSIKELEHSGKIVKNITKEEKEEEKEEIEEETTSKEKEPNKKRIGAWVTALVVALGLGYGANELVKAIKENRINLNHEQPNYTLATKKPTGRADKNEYIVRLNDVTANSQKIGEGLVAIKNGQMVSYEKFLEMLDAQKALSYSNMINISNYINGESLTGDVYIPDFTTLYDVDTNDHSVVEYFTGLRNAVVYYAYDFKDKKETKESIKDFEEKFVQFVFGNKSLQINNKKYKFDSLSPSAKYTIVQIGMGMLVINQDFKVEVNDVKYNRMTTIEDIVNLEVELFDNLKSQQKIKK